MNNHLNWHSFRVQLIYYTIIIFSKKYLGSIVAF